MAFIISIATLLTIVIKNSRVSLQILLRKRFKPWSTNCSRIIINRIVSSFIHFAALHDLGRQVKLDRLLAGGGESPLVLNLAFRALFDFLLFGPDGEKLKEKVAFEKYSKNWWISRTMCTLHLLCESALSLELFSSNTVLVYQYYKKVLVNVFDR